jgi:hypothetical protein
MRRLRKLLALPSTERRLLVKAVLLLAGIRLGLRLLPFRMVVGLLDSATRVSIAVPEAPYFPPDRIGWAVSVAGPYVLGVRPCLAQALTVQLLLKRRGHPARLRLGVARGGPGHIQAHAWVESNGKVVIGGSTSELERYAPLLALDARPA